MLDHLIVTIYGYRVSIHRLIHGFALTSCPLQKLTPGFPGGFALGDGFRTVTVR